MSASRVFLKISATSAAAFSSVLRASTFSASPHIWTSGHSRTIEPSAMVARFSWIWPSDRMTANFSWMSPESGRPP